MQKTFIRKPISVLLSLLMVLSVFGGLTLTASAEGTTKAIALGELYYIGDTIEFSGSLPWVRYDDDSSADYSAQLLIGDNTTVTAPTYDKRCAQWKFNNVWKYDYYGFTSYNLRITGPADVSPIGFKCAGGAGTKNDPYTFEGIYPVAGVVLNKDVSVLNVGDTEVLVATVSPDNATDKAVTWTSSDESVATVADGVVSAVSGGTAIITVTTNDGSFTATCAVTVPCAEHTYADNTWIIDANTHTRTCTVCGYTQEAGHTWAWVTDQEADCGNDGIKHQKCTACGATQNEGTPIPATGQHTAGDEEIEVEPVSCVKDGYVKTTVKCTVCGTVLEATEYVVPTTGHNTEIVGAKEATATEDGYTGDEVCTVCGETIKTGEVIPADEPADNSFRCNFCDRYEAWKDTPVFGWIVSLVHIFVHMAAHISYLT